MLQLFNSSSGGFMVNLTNKFPLIFLFCLLCLGFLNASDIVLTDTQMIKVKTSQIIITEKGHYILDDRFNTFIPVKGFINLNNETFALLPSLHSDLEAGRRVFGETWICPKNGCGYENYDGIEYCAICHTKRDRSKE